MTGVFRSSVAEARVMREYCRVREQWPVPREERTIDTRWGPTFVISCGPPHAPSVMLLHGAQANSAAWLPDIPLWSRRFRLHAVDMIGEAGLSAQVRPSLEGDAHARWLGDVMAGLGVARAALVGTSLGGWLAIDHAVRRPEAVAALALIGPAGVGRQRNFLLSALPWLLLGPLGKRRIRQMVFGPPPEPLPAPLATIAPLMDEIGRAIRPRVTSIPRLSDVELAGLSMPLLAIVGGRDALLDSRDTRARLKTHVPEAEICFIEDGYHFLPGQAGRVHAFLERSLVAAH